MDTHTAIAVSGLRRSYGGHQPDALSLFVNPLKAMTRFRPTPYEAVRGIDLEVRTGELFALLGTNGAGKTSALEVIEGLAPASAGTVEVLGQDPYADARTVRPRTGVMLQEAGFPNGLTAEETATMWAGTLTTPRPVSEALAMVGLTGRRAVATKSLSGGERRRLDLALAILGRPEVLFLDEPTTGLDPESRHAAWELISSLLAEGTTVMLTTHYLEEAERLADRIAIMHAGRIVTRGTLDEIVADQPSRIAFTAPALTDHHAPATLPDLPGAAVTVRGDDVRISTPTLQRTLHQLLQWADGSIDLVGLDARAASLEQAFLAVAQDSASPSSGSTSTSTVSPTFSTEEISA